MELLVKLYADKPCRIAVKYIYEFQARRAYEELLTRGGGDSVEAILELKKGKIDLSLRSDYSGAVTRYEGLSFKGADVQKLGLRKENQKFDFVHIFPQSNTLLVAKPFRQARFLTISRFEFIGMELADPAFTGQLGAAD